MLTPSESEKTKFTKLVEKVEIDTSVVCSFEEAAWIRKGVINTERESEHIKFSGKLQWVCAESILCLLGIVAPE